MDSQNYVRETDDRELRRQVQELRKKINQLEHDIDEQLVTGEVDPQVASKIRKYYERIID